MARDPRQLIGEAGWIAASELLAEVSRSTVGNWVAAGKLVRQRPGVLAVPSAAANWRIRVAAALSTDAKPSRVPSPLWPREG